MLAFDLNVLIIGLARTGFTVILMSSTTAYDRSVFPSNALQRSSVLRMMSISPKPWTGETKVDTAGSCTLRSLAHHSHDQTLSYGFLYAQTNASE